MSAEAAQRWTLRVVCVSTALLLLLRTWPLPWYAGQRLDLPTIYELGLFAAVTACMLFLGIYTWRLSKEARQMSAALAATELVLAEGLALAAEPPGDFQAVLRHLRDADV